MAEYAAKRRYQDDTVARSYDAQFSRPRLSDLRARLYGWLEERTFLRLLRDTPRGGTVLDIAAGTGRYTKHLLDRGHRVGGVDISEPMLRFARERLGAHANLLFLQVVDAAALPFTDGQFDGIICMRLYHLVPARERRRMLREVVRVGRGWAILYFGVTGRWLRMRRAIRNLLSGHVADPYPVTIRQLEAEVAQAGMKLEEIRWVARGLGDGVVARVSWEKRSGWTRARRDDMAGSRSGGAPAPSPPVRRRPRPREPVAR